MKLLLTFLSLFMATQLYGQEDTINRSKKSLFMAYLTSATATIATTAICVDQFVEAPHATNELILVSIGPTLGPSIGHIYAKDYKRATIGVLIRGIGFAIFWDAFQNDLGNENPTKGSQAAIGSALYLSGIFYSVFTIPSSVNDYNKNNKKIAVSPIFQPRRKLVGLSFGITM